MTKELTPEEKAAQDAADKDCNLAKKEHKYSWLWDGLTMTYRGVCGRCGHIEYLSRRHNEKT